MGQSLKIISSLLNSIIMVEEVADKQKEHIPIGTIYVSHSYLAVIVYLTLLASVLHL